MPKLSVVVTVDSDIAYQSLNGQNLISAALIAANEFCIETSLPNKLYVAAADVEKVRNATANLSFDFAEIKCNPNNSAELAAAIKDLDFSNCLTASV